MLKLAVIDLGTNVIKLLVGTMSQGGYRMLYEKKFSIVMNQHFPYATPIFLECEENIINILLAIRKQLDIERVTSIVARATSLFREASNAAEVIAAIRLKTGLEVEIISGIEEANLIYLSISTFLTLSGGPGLIVDIGGGSVECVIFNDTQPLWENSFELGIHRVASLFSCSDPITPVEVDVIEAYYRTVLMPLFVATKLHKPNKLIGSSGAFRTLLILYKYHYTDAIIQTSCGLKKLSIEQFRKIYQIMLTTSFSIWQHKVPIESFYLKLVPFSAILINLIISICNLQEIVISDYSLRIGLFIREWSHFKMIPSTCTREIR